MSALYTKNLASERGEKNVLNHEADTQKSLLCGGEKVKGEKVKKKKEENAWEVRFIMGNEL